MDAVVAILLLGLVIAGCAFAILSGWMKWLVIYLTILIVTIYQAWRNG